MSSRRDQELQSDRNEKKKLNREVKAELDEKAHRYKINPMFQDRGAEVGSAVMMVVDTLTSDYVKPALIPAFDSAIGIAMKGSLPGNVSKDEIDKSVRAITKVDINDTNVLEEERERQAHGLTDFIVEDIGLLGDAISQGLYAMYEAPNLKIIKALREAHEALKDSSCALLGWNLGITAVSGVLNTLSTWLEIPGRALTAADTRFFYFATGLLSGKSDLDAGKNVLWDRVNWTVRNICGDNPGVARALGVLLIAGYFLSSWPAKQAAQVDLNMAKNTTKFFGKGLEMLAFRSKLHSAKSFLEAVSALYGMLPTLLMPADMIRGDVTEKFKDQAKKLKILPHGITDYKKAMSNSESLSGALSPTNWSRLYHLGKSDGSWRAYERIGTSAWLTQLVEGIYQFYARKKVEPWFNKILAQSWKDVADAEQHRRVEDRFRARVKPGEDRELVALEEGRLTETREKIADIEQGAEHKDSAPPTPAHLSTDSAPITTDISTLPTHESQPITSEPVTQEEEIDDNLQLPIQGAPLSPLNVAPTSPVSAEGLRPFSEQQAEQIVDTSSMSGQSIPPGHSDNKEKVSQSETHQDISSKEHIDLDGAASETRRLIKKNPNDLKAKRASAEIGQEAFQQRRAQFNQNIQTAGLSVPGIGFHRTASSTPKLQGNVPRTPANPTQTYNPPSLTPIRETVE